MKKIHYIEKQIAIALKHTAAGTGIGKSGRNVGISAAAFYILKKELASLGVTELRHLRQLEDVNQRLNNW
ncbi:hypothetical protein M8R21_47440 [Klebsiella sp. T2.Ur]|nr:hypothetical protein [Klebsiella sp. T2.Ur]